MGRRTLMRSIPGLSGSELRAEGLTQVNSVDPLNASDQDSPIFDIYFFFTKKKK